MKRFNKFLLASCAIAVMISCTIEDSDPEPEVAASIVGTWEFTTITFFGQNVPGDGSTLQFDECGANECTGVDYKASDESSSTFTYTLYADDSVNFVDNDPSNGGNYNGTWLINNLTSTDLELEKDFGAFGIQVIEMTKQ